MSELHTGRNFWVVGREENRLEVPNIEPISRIQVFGSVQLHNRVEIDSLLRSGDRRPCTTDLERIAAGYEAFGDSWFRRLRGSFSVVLSGKDEFVVAARDQLGVFPLYYIAAPGALYVSTDLRVLTELDLFDWSLDPLGLAHAVSGLWGDPTATVWRKIRRVPAGHLAKTSGAVPYLSDYWAPGDRIRLQGKRSFDDCAQQLRVLLAQAVDRNLGPGRTALDLSGGFDSSTIAGLAAGLQSQSSDRILALTHDLSDPRYTDMPYAKSVVDMYDLDWRLVQAGANKAESRARAARWRDLPGSYHVDEQKLMFKIAAQEGALRYLSGLCGDLVLVGESWAALMRHILMFRPAAAQRHASSRGHTLKADLWEILRRHPLYARVANRYRPRQRYRFLAPELRSAAGLYDRPILPSPLRPNAAIKSRSLGLRFPQHQRALELLHRLGVEAGVTVGQPFADVDLVEFVLGVPPEYLVGYPQNRRLHAAAVRDILPSMVADRTDKANFIWSAIDAVDSRDPEYLIDHSYLASNGWMDRDEAQRVLQRVRGRSTRGESPGWELWEVIGLVETEVFLQTVMNGSRAASGEWS